ncbi:MAG: tripartite tricarboxylate transporter substrate binding protein [Betaproteobacteria bacterium]
MKLISSQSIKNIFYILLFSLLSTTFVNAQNWPSRAITIIVPYAPGTTDQEARRLAELISKIVGQPVVVENKEGAGGAIGTQFVARSKPDGYTFLFAAPAVITIAPLMGNALYKYEDLMPVARTTSAPHVLASRADAPFKNVNEMLAYAKANPGNIVFGSSGTSTAVHLAGETMADVAGISLKHIPYKGLSPAITAALGGFVDVVIGLPVAIKPQIDAGKMRAIAQFGATRATAIQDVPTLKESGVNVNLSVDLGLFGPAGITPSIVANINEAVAKAVNTEEFKAFASRALAAPAYLPADDYKKIVDGERALYARLVPKIKLIDK